MGNKRLSWPNLLLVISLVVFLLPTLPPAPPTLAMPAAPEQAPEPISPDAPPEPLPHDCLGVTPPGQSPPACCLYGYIYSGDAPVAAANVHIESPHGSLDTTTAVGGGAGTKPYYSVPLSPAPLLAVPGETITVTTHLGDRVTSRTWVVRSNSQQVDLGLVDGYQDPEPIAFLDVLPDDTEDVYLAENEPLVSLALPVPAPLSRPNAQSISGTVVFSEGLTAVVTDWQRTEISAQVPDGAVDGDVAVQTAWGTSNGAPFALGSSDTPDPAGVGTTWATTFSGDINSDTTWDQNILLTGDVTVTAGVTLTINPGVTVFFAARSDDRASGYWTQMAELNIWGTLVAEGTPAAPIYFTSNAASPASSDWAQIGIRKGSLNSSLRYCVVQYSYLGVHFRTYDEGSATIGGTVRNCTIQHNNYGLTLAAQPGNNGTVIINPVIADNLIRDNPNYGIYLEMMTGWGTVTSNAVVENNVIENSSTGILVAASSWWLGHVDHYPVIRNNTVRGCGSFGVDVQAHGSSDSSGSDTDVRPTLEHNLIENNTTNLRLYILPNGTDGTQVLAPTIRYNTIRNATYGITIEENGPYDTLTPVLTDNVFYGLSGYVIDNNTARTTIDASHNYWGATEAEWDAGPQPGDTEGPVTISGYLNSSLPPLLTRIAPAVAQAGAAITLYGANFGPHGTAAPDAAFVAAPLRGYAPLTVAFVNQSEGTVTEAFWSYGDGTTSTTLALTHTHVFETTGVYTVSLTVSGPEGTDIYTRTNYIEVTTPLANGVIFADQLSAATTSWNTVQISAQVPAGTVDGDVVVQTAWGASNGAPFALGSSATPDPAGVGTTWVTTFSGDINSDTTWDQNILLTGDVTVAAGVTLTINPGVTVFFAARSDDRATGYWIHMVELSIYGTLIAEGTPAAPIYFTSNAASPAPSDWAMINIRRGSLYSSLRYCVVQYSYHGVRFGTYNEGNAPISGTVRNCTIQHNNVGVIITGQLENGTTTTLSPIVANNLIKDNTTNGIEVTSVAGSGAVTVNAVIENNVIENSSTGILVAGSSWWLGHVDNYPIIRNNTIRGCGSFGVDVQAHGSSDSSGSDTDVRPTLEHNLIENNTTNLRLYILPNGTDGTQVLAPTIRYNTIRNATYGIIVHENNPYDTLTPVLTDNVFYGLSGYVIDNNTARTTIDASHNYWGATEAEWDAGPQPGDTEGPVTISGYLNSSSPPLLTRIAPAVAQAGAAITLHGANLGPHGTAAPDAAFVAAPLRGYAPLTVILTNTTAGDATGYLWAYGDGSTSTTADPTHSHVFQNAGVYTVSLQATGPGGADTMLRSAYITVDPVGQTPHADFEALPLSGPAPLDVQLIDRSTGSGLAWDWLLGDGSPSGARHPFHTYQDEGLYTVSLTVYGPDGPGTRTKTDYIHVSPTGRTWTLILYLAGDNNLSPAMERTIDRLERVADRHNVTILALWDGWHYGDTRLYKIRYDTAPGIVSPALSVGWNTGEMNTGSAQTLTFFVDWARATYPADHYLVSIADHGRGTSGIAWDDTNGDDYLTAYSELETALSTISNDGADPIDVLLLDTCLMAMLEDAYEFKDDVRYLVASQNLGWSAFPYDRYVTSITADSSPRQLAQDIARLYMDSLSGYPGTISALDMAALDEVGAAADALSEAFLDHLYEFNVWQLMLVRNGVQTFDSRDYTVLDASDEYVDLYHLAQLSAALIDSAAIRDAAQQVMDAVEACVIAEYHRSGQDPWSANYWDLDDAHGLSIYFPARSSGWDYANYVTGGSWAFCAQTSWDDFLQNYFLISHLPPEAPQDPGLPSMNEVKYQVFLPVTVKNP